MIDSILQTLLAVVVSVGFCLLYFAGSNWLLDHVLARGMQPVGITVPHGRNWWRMSDHLPLIAEFEWADAQ